MAVILSIRVLADTERYNPAVVDIMASSAPIEFIHQHKAVKSFEWGFLLNDFPNTFAVEIKS